MRPEDHELEELRHTLAEREKELDALYRLATLFSRTVGDVRSVIRDTASILRTSMEHPDLVEVVITTDKHTETCSGHEVSGTSETSDEHVAERTYSIARRIRVAVRSSTHIDDREKHLITSTTELLAHLLQRKELDQVLVESTKTLQRQATELESKNVALREVLSQIEHEKKSILQDARAHVDTYIRPYLHEVAERTENDSIVRSRVQQLEASLDSLLNQDNRRLVEIAHRLSPREVEISGLIRNGLTTKEISSFLNISETTVERHRNTIRRKLNLNNSNINLTSYLRSAQ